MIIRVAIVEDDLQTRDGLKARIESSNELRCAGAFEDAESFANRFRHLDVDVVLMDIDLPGTTGIECVAKLKQIKPQVQFLMCTNLEDDDSIFSALSLGATGYLIKNTTIERLSDSIKDIYSGGSPMSPQIARKVTQAFRKEREVSKLFEALTGREKEIVELLSQGYTYKLIADRLAIATDTVRTYIRNIYSKLQVHCRTDALNRLFPKIRRV